MIFNRYWALEVEGNAQIGQLFAFTIEPDDAGNSLRIQFDISATIDARYYSGTIKIFNLAPDKRESLRFNLLLDEFGTGPKVKLTAGYETANGIIFDGVVHRGFNSREVSTGDWITTLQVGLPFKQDKYANIEPLATSSLALSQGVASYLSSTVRKLFNQENRFAAKFSSSFDRNMLSEINTYFDAGNTVGDSIGFSGNSISILDEIQDRFNLIIFSDSNGLNVAGKRYRTVGNSETPITSPETTTPELTLSKDTTLIGSPVYTDTGAKVISYLRPELRVFQYIRVESSVLDRNISILELNHRGDTHTDEWYSEIDGSNLNQLVA